MIGAVVETMFRSFVLWKWRDASKALGPLVVNVLAERTTGDTNLGRHAAGFRAKVILTPSHQPLVQLEDVTIQFEQIDHRVVAREVAQELVGDLRFLFFQRGPDLRLQFFARQPDDFRQEATKTQMLALEGCKLIERRDVQVGAIGGGSRRFVYNRVCLPGTLGGRRVVVNATLPVAALG